MYKHTKDTKTILWDLTATEAALIVAGIETTFTASAWYDHTPDGKCTVYANCIATPLSSLHDFAQGVRFALASSADAPFATSDPESIVQAAQEHLDAAIAHLENYCDTNRDFSTRHYILNHLRTMPHSEYGSREHNLDRVLRRLRNEPDPEESDDE